MCAEAAWILSGDNRVETISPYSKLIHYYSDDGSVFFGAYGPKIVRQLPYVIRTLIQDKDSRQAVINIWRESPPITKDPPCTLNCHFMIRGNKLNVFVNMRSSDVWLGVPYDIFNFSMLAGYVMLNLVDYYPDLKLGTLYQHAASRHLYDKDWDATKMMLRSGNGDTIYLSPFDPLNQFKRDSDLIKHLWAMARQEESNLCSTWLKPIYGWRWDKEEVGA
jgi:thymidylate synthase